MNIYSLLRIATSIRSQRMKLLGIALFHFIKRRYFGVYLDPVLACNFRCKMCYFSDVEKRKELTGIMSEQDVRAVAKAVFHRAVKLQIGCGAEPTLYPQLEWIVGLGKKYNVPYISLTTNGFAVTRELLFGLVKAGLDELTLSMHGVTKETYETLMVNGKYDRFCALVDMISEVKMSYPNFKFRINYTMNEDNIEELVTLFDVFPNLLVDILQLRPIQKIGNSEYCNFSMQKLYDCFDTVIKPLCEECDRRNIVCIAPTKENLAMLGDLKTDDEISKFTYCYVSPNKCWTDDFDFRNETFEQYSRRHHRGLIILKTALLPFKKSEVVVTRKMNYTVG